MASTDLVRKEPDRLDELARLGTWLAKSESGASDEVSRGAAAALRLYYAQQLGLTPMAAAELTVIKGRLYVGAQLLRALAVRAGYRVLRVDLSADKCTARLVAPDGQNLGESSFTIEDATRAGLVRDNSPWKTHPSRMLWARASKNVIVDFAPEIALGIALDDELQEVAPGVNNTVPPAPFDYDYEPAEDPAIEWPDPAEAEAETVEALEEMTGDE